MRDVVHTSPQHPASVVWAVTEEHHTTSPHVGASMATYSPLAFNSTAIKCIYLNLDSQELSYLQLNYQELSKTWRVFSERSAGWWCWWGVIDIGFAAPWPQINQLAANCTLYTVHCTLYNT